MSAEHSRLSSEGANAPLSTRASDTHSYVTEQERVRVRGRVRVCGRVAK